MISKLKNLANFRREKIELVDISSIKNNLCNGLFIIMEKAYTQRKSDAENSKYSLSDVDKIINQYSQKNMVLAAATSIIPGPFGILGSIPELLLNFNNQMNMIYDLSCATGKENFINKDILLDIPIAAFGGNTNLSNIQDNSIDLMSSSENILLEKATILGRSIIDRTLKKSIVQFIPVAGPILMGTWAKMTTNKISKGSLNFLSNHETYSENFKPDESPEIKRQLQKEKIKALVNLIESNNDINENQIDLIGVIIENSDIIDSEKEYLLQESLKTGSFLQLNKKLIKDYEEEEDLLMQLVIMAKRSGQIDKLEKEYIFEVGNELEFENSFINNLFEN